MSFYKDRHPFVVTVHNDRPAHIDRPDPVAAREGVFGLIEREALSPQEKTRLEKADRQDEADRTVKAPIWTPAGILKRLTALYARLRPSEKTS